MSSLNISMRGRNEGTGMILDVNEGTVNEGTGMILCVLRPPLEEMTLRPER